MTAACCSARRRRGRELARWCLPAALLALVPKCPACLVAYLAAATGLGLSLTTARWIGALVMAACLGGLCYLAVSRLVAPRRMSR